MPQRVYKYPLSKATQQSVEVPEGAVLLRVDFQSGVPTLWALVDPDVEREPITIIIVNTGDAIEVEEGEELRYISTLLDGQYVSHAFELVDE